ncbi:Hypothetical_protein [Hexamita inflata]|uniref:Hypothetical_protein n=1 Tax=Hexamita inflata TaxID=28002 RepID=A0AA86U378_9EUKA|nr:Hypothetical protein HINF_LOCUS24047 [Hexamita inflata]
MFEYNKFYVDLNKSIPSSPLYNVDKAQNALFISYQNSYVEQIKMERRLEQDATLAAHYKNSHSSIKRPISPGFKQVQTDWKPTNPQLMYLSKTQPIISIKNDKKFLKVIDIDLEKIIEETRSQTQSLKKRQRNEQVVSCPSLAPLVKVPSKQKQ